VTDDQRGLVIQARSGAAIRSLHALVEVLELWGEELPGQEAFRLQRLVDRLQRKREAA
jgi:hypothetical protein